MKPISAVIAEDEPLLAESLKRELARAWPALFVAAVVGDGESAVKEALALQPDVLFLDIQMPVMTGLEAAFSLAEQLPDSHNLPLLVFVTAYDQYAVQAFEVQAVDYVLKPVRADRLAKTIERVQQRLALQASEPPSAASFDATTSQLRQIMQSMVPPQPRLERIQASRQTASGTTIHMVPMDDVVYFEAADKYIRVLTAEQEYLIRTPLKELIGQLDPNVFWQVHRGTVVRVNSIASVHRDESFKVMLKLRERPETLAVSRLYGYLFKAM
ncbi:MAG: LytTR family DNA-binding domain-containing protein [Cytophagales bacterium]|nr:LytTR family DNA-binding domain-containing protein [Cytophagales bacterium]